MANRIILLSLLLACLAVNVLECRYSSRGGSRSRSGGGSRGSHGGYHSSGSHYTPSFSTYQHPSITHSTYNGDRFSYPSSSSGLSGHTSSQSNTGTSFGSSFPSTFGSGSNNMPSSFHDQHTPSRNSGSSGVSYPSTSGLSGTGKNIPSSPPGSSSHDYPKSPSGLSGSSNNKPPQTSILSGGSHDYPLSSSGLSGDNNKKKLPTSSVNYPPSKSGLSGTGHNNIPPSSTNLSGSGHNQQSSISSSNHGYPSSATGLSGSGSNKSAEVFGSTSQNSYNTNNRYGYGPGNNNPGSHIYSKVHHGQSYNVPHYSAPNYYSSPQYVYINEYRNSGSRYSDLLSGLALYNLGRSYSHHHDHYYYDDYYRRRYEPANSYASNRPQDSATCTLKVKEENRVEILKIPCEIVSTFTKDTSETKIQSYTNQTVCVTNTTTVNNTMPGNVTAVNNAMSNITVTNSTMCTSTINGTDPLTMKGSPVNSSKIECAVGIQTKERYIQKNVDCNILIKYAKMPEPKKQESFIMPSRQKLKSWLAKPPWWLSLFISV